MALPPDENNYLLLCALCWLAAVLTVTIFLPH